MNYLPKVNFQINLEFLKKNEKENTDVSLEKNKESKEIADDLFDDMEFQEIEEEEPQINQQEKEEDPQINQQEKEEEFIEVISDRKNEENTNPDPIEKNETENEEINEETKPNQIIESNLLHKSLKIN